jgi:hypothetical protein
MDRKEVTVDIFCLYQMFFEFGIEKTKNLHCNKLCSSSISFADELPGVNIAKATGTKRSLDDFDTSREIRNRVDVERRVMS